MRRLLRPAAIFLLVALVTFPGVADKAKDLFAKGQDAEVRQNYEDCLRFLQTSLRSQAWGSALPRCF